MKIVSLDFQKLVTPSDLLCRHFFFLLLMHSIILLWLAYMLLYNTFHFFFSAGPFTFQCTLHKNGTIWFAYQAVIAFHPVLLITWKYWDGPSVATPISSLILLPLPLSVHSFHLCLNPFTLLKLSVFSHPIILGLSHSDFSVPILSFTLILLPPVHLLTTNHLLTTLPPFHGSSPHDQWYEVITLPSVYSFLQYLITPPLPFHLICHPASLHIPLSTLVDIRSCTRKLLTCGGIDDFWYQ